MVGGLLTKIMKPNPISLINPNSQSLNEVSVSLQKNKVESPETHFLIDEMIRIASGEQGNENRRAMVGLAAPQVGVNKRVILIDTVSMAGKIGNPEFRVYINPEIIFKSDEKELGREGCYSTGSICGAVERSSLVRIKAFDRAGKLIEEEWTGFQARIFQHEIDHLDGIRFPERITDPSKLHWVEPDRFGEYRVDWPTWPELCPPERWQAMKAGLKELD